MLFILLQYQQLMEGKCYRIKEEDLYVELESLYKLFLCVCLKCLPQNFLGIYYFIISLA